MLSNLDGSVLRSQPISSQFADAIPSTSDSVLSSDTSIALFSELPPSQRFDGTGIIAPVLELAIVDQPTVNTLQPPLLQSFEKFLFSAAAE